jgi:hypothetical protein
MKPEFKHPYCQKKKKKKERKEKKKKKEMEQPLSEWFGQPGKGKH